MTGAACPACRQQLAGSEFITELNEGGETVPGVRYTVLATRTDWVVTPHTSSYLKPDGSAEQSALQDHCPLDATSHLGINYHKTATRIVLNALDPEHAEPPTC